MKEKANSPKTTSMRSLIYGITEYKKNELDALLIQVQDAQYEVNKYQAIVQSLTAKSTNFAIFLQNADAAKTLALSNLNQIQNIALAAKALENASINTLKEADTAQKQSALVTKNVKLVMDQLIYCVEIINKMSNLIIRKKAVNPLISDEMVNLVGNTGKDINNAIALTLVALNSSFIANVSTLESKSTLTLGKMQATTLHNVLTVDNSEENVTPQALLPMLEWAYHHSKKQYDQAFTANNEVNKQLNQASAKLDKATTKLNSLQSGYAAANAAALAS